MAVENCAMRNLINLLCSPHITRVNKRRQRSRSGHGTGEQCTENFGYEICRERKYSRESGKKKRWYRKWESAEPTCCAVRGCEIREGLKQIAQEENHRISQRSDSVYCVSQTDSLHEATLCVA